MTHVHMQMLSESTRRVTCVATPRLRTALPAEDDGFLLAEGSVPSVEGAPLHGAEPSPNKR